MPNISLKTFYDAFDRADIWIDDHPGQAWIDQLPEGVTFKPETVEFHPRWKYVLVILQPSFDTLLLLQQMVGTHIAVQVKYVEVARDYPARWRLEAARLMHYFLRTVTMRYGPSVVTKHKNTFYYRERKAARRLAAYSDRRSKLKTPALGHHCLHTEIRLKTTELIERMGLGSIDALLSFDFASFWAEQIRYHSFGSRSAMGAALQVPTRGSAGEGAHQARVRRALKSPKYMAGNAFVLQMLIRRHPGLAKTLVQMTPTAWLRNAAREIAVAPRDWH